jgi:hypothetical protein
MTSPDTAYLDAVAAFNAMSAREGWDQYCDSTLAFGHSDFPRMLAIWKEQAAGQPIPARSSMTPRALKDFLPRIAINERASIDPPRFKWRLMGTQIAQVLGERTGKFIDEDAPPRQIARWNASLDLVLRAVRPLRFAGRVLVNGKTYLNSELLFMPLAGDSGQPRFVLGFGRYGLDMPAFEPRAELASAGTRP